jgi:starch synthase
LPVRYDAQRMIGKTQCKLALQTELGLPVDERRALLGVIGRLTHQKGFDVLAHSLWQLLQWDLQIVLLGTGDADAEAFFAEQSRAHGDRFRAVIGFNDALAHRIEAGSDLFLMPSRFEPCGLNQMYSSRYGSVPVVRRTGGLNDTVENYVEASGSGTGFLFDDLTVDALTNTVGWALSTYYDRPGHFAQLRASGMARDFSWDRAAAQYEVLYREAYRRRRGHPFEG